MSRKKKWGAFAATLAVVALAGYGAFQWQRRNQPDICQHSWREIHPGVLTIAEVDGKETRFCCPACALTTAEQTGKPVRVLRLSDFYTHQPLEPAAAFLVRGSEANLCTHPHPLVSEEKQPLDVHFDRCAPSILAFRSREEAEAFRQEHGGEVLRLADLGPHLFAR